MIRVDRTWGYYIILDSTEQTVTKKLILEPGKAISLQSHNNRDEHWVIISGEAIISDGTVPMQVKPGEYFFIPKHQIHQIRNISKFFNLEIIEVQFGECDEKDITRYE